MKGVSQKVAADMADQWMAVKAMRDLVMFLQAHDLPISLAPRLSAAYTPGGALAVLKSNPFALVTEVRCVTVVKRTRMRADVLNGVTAPARAVASASLLLTRSH